MTGLVATLTATAFTSLWRVKSLRKNRLTSRVFPSGELIALSSGWFFSLFQPFTTLHFRRFAPVELPDRCRMATPLGNRLFMPPPLPA
jgi:hypothetical protein